MMISMQWACSNKNKSSPRHLRKFHAEIIRSGVGANMTNKILSHFSEVLGFGGEINDKVIAHAEREMKQLITPHIGDKVQVISKDFAAGTIFPLFEISKIVPAAKSFEITCTLSPI